MEVLIVLVVIGLIAAVAVPQLMKMLGGAKHRAAAIQIETVVHGVDNFQLDTGAYPSQEQGLAALWTAPGEVPTWSGPYVRREKQLVDPWGHPLVYHVPGKSHPYAVLTLGADGQPGGTGENADISSEE